MIHGGDIITYKDKFNGSIIDYSSNINPLGPPKGLRKVFESSYNDLTVYPDIKYRELKENISAYLGCKEDEVIVGNGAVEIINNISLIFNRTVVFTPCFYEYMERPRVLGKEVIKIPMKENFSLDLETLEGVLRNGDLLILGNPNNPTGLRIPKKELLEISYIVNKAKGFLLLDEAFFEFCPRDYDSIQLFNDLKNISVIRAATKFFALPGIRLGYGFASRNFVNEYSKIESPWSVNAFANAAARHIFMDKAYIEDSKTSTKKERDFILNELSNIKWLKAFYSDTNFILIKLLKYNEDTIFNSFIRSGILVRKASTFEGLDQTYIRIAVKDSVSNKRLIKTFKEFE